MFNGLKKIFITINATDSDKRSPRSLPLILGIGALSLLSLSLSAGCSLQPFSAPGLANKTTSVTTSISMKNATTTSQQTNTTNYNTALTVADQRLAVEVAGTDQTRQQGLSGRASLEADQGMLFDFSDRAKTKPGFWMKDMNFPLDFIWIDGDKIIGITPDIKPGLNAAGQLPLYYPPVDITAVLEVNAGWSMAHSIKVGDSVLRQ